MKKSLILFLILFFFLNQPLESLEIKNVAKINNKVITNLDLYYGIKLIEIFNKRIINKSESRVILNQLIELEIKESETSLYNIDYNEDVIIAETNKRLKLLNFENLDISLEDKKILKNRLINNLKIEYKWNRLIVILYANKLSINTNEINEISKDKNFDEKEKERLIEIEKNKKIQIFSKMHFNKIKKKYYIQY